MSPSILEAPVEPFLFGPAGDELYGALHTPSGGPPPAAAVVICNPVGHEYIRSHRALRLLAARLAGEGLAVLRFDWWGTGDSAGELEEAALDRWRDDLERAIREARRRARVRAVHLVGVRLGGALALEAAAARGDIDSLALWAPASGPSLIDEYAAEHRRLEDEIAMKLGRPPGEPSDEPPAGCREFVGHCFSEPMLEAVAALDPLALADPPARRVLLIGHNDDPVPLAGRLAALGVPVDRHTAPDEAAPWMAEPYRGLVPARTLAALVRWLAEIEP